MTAATKINMTTRRHSLRVALPAMTTTYSMSPRKRTALNMRRRRRMRNNRHAVSPWPMTWLFSIMVMESATLTTVTRRSKMFQAASDETKKRRPESRRRQRTSIEYSAVKQQSMYSNWRTKFLLWIKATWIAIKTVLEKMTSATAKWKAFDSVKTFGLVQVLGTEPSLPRPFELRQCSAEPSAARRPRSTSPPRCSSSNAECNDGLSGCPRAEAPSTLLMPTCSKRPPAPPKSSAGAP
mmetsp:Transcript_133892/g.334260  ORF Transcript_133892/g.334260 Transcript_133892/m.334260 type:complete len:238 (-) Transcript_133892:212-925(-)